MARPRLNNMQDEAEQLFSLSETALEKNQMATAIDACRTLNTQFPSHFAGWLLAGRIHLKLQKPEAGLISTARASIIKPNQPEILMQRAQCLSLLNRNDEALEILEYLAEGDFPTAQLHADVAMMLSAKQLHQSAIVHYQKAIRLNNKIAGLHYNLAAAYRFIGDLTECERALECAIQLDPLDSEAQMMRSSLRLQTPEKNHIDDLLDAYSRVEEDDKIKSGLCYAIAKEQDDLNNVGASFTYLSEGASIRRRRMIYDVERDEQIMQRIAETFQPRRQRPAPVNKEGPKPLFIVGLPRTGSTMLERMLDNHSDVRSMGELDTLGAALTKHSIAETNESPPRAEDLVELASSVDLKALAQTYMSDSIPQHFSESFFIDKLPLNFLYLGLIHQSMPDAKIIHITRHPVASCFAIYRQWFRDIYPFSYDLIDLARYFVAYKKLTDFWHSQMPEAIHTVEYERLVEQPEVELKKVLAFCGLPWEQNVLAFHENTSPSTTASAVQVRRPIHSKSKERWRRYASHLTSLIEALEKEGIDVA